jgi:hypothetical protein
LRRVLKNYTRQERITQGKKELRLVLKDYTKQERNTHSKKEIEACIKELPFHFVHFTIARKGEALVK